MCLGCECGNVFVNTCTGTCDVGHLREWAQFHRSCLYTHVIFHGESAGRVKQMVRTDFFRFGLIFRDNGDVV